MKILIITGNLAYPAILDIVKDSNKEVIVHKANTQIAAFLTPNQIIKEIKNNIQDQLDTVDVILVPGLIRRSTDKIAEELNIPTFKGPTDCADLGVVIDLIDNLNLATDKPADRLIEEEKEKEHLILLKISKAILKKGRNYLKSLITYW